MVVVDRDGKVVEYITVWSTVHFV